MGGMGTFAIEHCTWDLGRQCLNNFYLDTQHFDIEYQDGFAPYHSPKLDIRPLSKGFLHLPLTFHHFSITSHLLSD